MSGPRTWFTRSRLPFRLHRLGETAVPPEPAPERQERPSEATASPLIALGERGVEMHLRPLLALGPASVALQVPNEAQEPRGPAGEPSA